jgi:hypothetical protein
MFRRFALSAAVLFACVANARADVFIGTGAVQNGAGGFFVGVPPVAGDGNPNGINQLQGVTTFGNQYVNNITSNVFGTPGVVHTVGANLVSTYGYRAGGGQPATFSVGGVPQDVVLVFAARGNTTGLGSTSVFTATNIGAALYAVPTGTFNQNNPATWTSATQIASFGNIFSTTVHDNGPAAFDGGGPGIFNLSPGQVNQIGVNAQVGTSNQGFFLLSEINNQNFWNLIGNPGLLPNINPNAVVVRADEGYTVGDTLNTANLAANLGNLNNIFNTLLPGVAAIDGGVAFASAIGGLGSNAGPASSFNPSSGNPIPNTNDVIFSFGATTVLGNNLVTQQVPEPATLAVFAGVMGLGGFVYRRRKAKLVA